jgi:hypothetical protein
MVQVSLPALDPSISIAARILVAGVFGAALVGKLRHREEWLGIVANFRLVPERLGRCVAWLILSLEALVVAALVSGVGLRGGTLVAIVLFACFAVAIAINLARGRKHIDCGCFQSALRQPLSAALIVRNLLLIAASLPLLAGAAVSPSVLQLIDGVGTGLAMFTLYLAFGQLVAVRQAATHFERFA